MSETIDHVKSNEQKPNFENRQIAVINEEGEVFPSLAALAEWEEWVHEQLRQGEEDIAAGRVVSSEEAFARFDKILKR